MYVNHPGEYSQLILIGLLPMAERQPRVTLKVRLNGGRSNPAHNEAYGTVPFANLWTE